MMRSGAIALAAFVVAVVAMMIVPLPTPLLDVLLTSNLAVSVALLLVAVWSARTLELSTFPTLLVLTTLYRLALNVSSVRLILLQANAGRVIHAFGAFVVRGDYVVGFAVFLILTIVQYVVISRGAERVAEVAARFALDAMPGKQLAIDADLRAAAIDANEARSRRNELSKEAALYGALDGAMRFVKGDAIAGILILAISLTAGLIVGVVQHGMSLGEAARVYSLLTIGDGLVSQLPALLISTAAGLVVTRVASDEEGATLGPDLARQLLRPGALAATAGLLVLLALVPGLPLWPFMLVAAGTGGLAWMAQRRQRARPVAAIADAPHPAPPLEVALDPALHAAAPTVEARLHQVTRALADELGLLVPPLTLTIDARLPLRGYEIRLRGIPMADGIIPDGRVLVDVAPNKLPAGVDGQAVDHPATGAPAAWVPSSAVAKLPASGLGMLDGPAAIAARLDSALRNAAPELVGLDETQRLLDAVAREHPALVRALVPARADVTLVADILRRLVAEGVSVRDLPSVLEALARSVAETRDPMVLTERIRGQLKRLITHRFAPSSGGARRVDALMLDADAEEAVRGALRASGDTIVMALEPDLADAILASVTRELGLNRSTIILTSAELRRHVRRLVEGDHPRLPVLAYQELLSDVEVEQVGTIRITE
ncbi:MAG: type secretion protein LcrD/AscV [Myxococcales bacterium]|nr:type secretion protein LcrD/AscV [Myxococcales bacterium]